MHPQSSLTYCYVTHYSSVIPALAHQDGGGNRIEYSTRCRPPEDKIRHISRLVHHHARQAGTQRGAADGIPVNSP